MPNFNGVIGMYVGDWDVRTYIAGATINPGSPVMLDADGRVVPWDGDASNEIIGFALMDPTKGGPDAVAPQYLKYDAVPVMLKGAIFLEGNGGDFTVGEAIDITVSEGEFTFKPSTATDYVEGTELLQAGFPGFDKYILVKVSAPFVVNRS